jgi:hypothetical protein
LSATATSAACPVINELRPRPFSPNQGAWSSSDQPPATVTRGFSCTDDTDCVDRNQWCDPKAGDYPATNGWGRCVDGRDAGPFDTTQLPNLGLSVTSVFLGADAGCSFGFECMTGECASGRCR